MKETRFFICTNNPMAAERLGDEYEISYEEQSFADLLIRVRDLVHQGHRLLSHPLSGSVKPGETPYKSILVSNKTEKTDGESVRLIGNAIRMSGNFPDLSALYDEKVLRDFQTVDWHLLQSALTAAKTAVI